MAIMVRQRGGVFGRHMTRCVSSGHDRRYCGGQRKRVIPRRLSLHMAKHTRHSSHKKLFYGHVTSHRNGSGYSSCRGSVRRRATRNFIQSRVVNYGVSHQVSMFQYMVFRLVIHGGRLYRRYARGVVQTYFFPNLVHELHFVFPYVDVIGTLIRPIRAILYRRYRVGFRYVGRRVYNLFVWNKMVSVHGRSRGLVDLSKGYSNVSRLCSSIINIRAIGNGFVHLL